jgi:hypothetical protein
MENSARPDGHVTSDSGSSHLHDDLMMEYYRISDIVAGFDQRLLTVKSWGVTFALATLALGFQQDHYGLFLVAAVGALSFWTIEASMKRHQMRFYPRQNDIEIIAFELYQQGTSRGPVSAPLTQWSWATVGDPGPPQPLPARPATSAPGSALAGFSRVMLYPHVALPHALAFVLGLILFLLGLAGRFGPI